MNPPYLRFGNLAPPGLEIGQSHCKPPKTVYSKRKSEIDRKRIISLLCEGAQTAPFTVDAVNMMVFT
jgi:hypothetical protein